LNSGRGTTRSSEERGSVPEWLGKLATVASQLETGPLTPPADGGGRPSAVLILFGDGVAGGEHCGDGVAGGEHCGDADAAGEHCGDADAAGEYSGDAGERSGPDLLLIQRSDDLRLHAGQPAFPGGAIDDCDSGPVAAALREAAEETGLDPEGVEVVGVLPEMFIPRTMFRVVPVLAWWRRPCAVAPVDIAEVAAVERIRVSELADPATRLMVRAPSGHTSPAFRVRGMLIWGFTALLIDRLLALGGWEVPWDHSVVVDAPSRPR